MKTPTELTQLFRDRGLRVTPQRQCIFRALYGDSSHPTAHAVFDSLRQEMPTTSLRTVYQTLNDLVALGEIRQFDVGTGAARFDPTTGEHHHLVCIRCGAIRDVDLGPAGPSFPARPLHGFAISGSEVIFRGLCAKCSQTTTNQKDAAKA
jgi:Fe2+ or Zn2+ uptake regulation protein